MNLHNELNICYEAYFTNNQGGMLFNNEAIGEILESKEYKSWSTVEWIKIGSKYFELCEIIKHKKLGLGISEGDFIAVHFGDYVKGKEKLLSLIKANIVRVYAGYQAYLYNEKNRVTNIFYLSDYVQFPAVQVIQARENDQEYTENIRKTDVYQRNLEYLHSRIRIVFGDNDKDIKIFLQNVKYKFYNPGETGMIVWLQGAKGLGKTFLSGVSLASCFSYNSANIVDADMMRLSSFTADLFDVSIIVFEDLTDARIKQMTNTLTGWWSNRHSRTEKKGKDATYETYRALTFINMNSTIEERNISLMEGITRRSLYFDCPQLTPELAILQKELLATEPQIKEDEKQDNWGEIQANCWLDIMDSYKVELKRTIAELKEATNEEERLAKKALEESPDFWKYLFYQKVNSIPLFEKISKAELKDYIITRIGQHNENEDTETIRIQPNLAKFNTTKLGFNEDNGGWKRTNGVDYLINNPAILANYKEYLNYEI